MTEELIETSQRTHFQIAMVLAIIADALQLVFLPLFVEGAESPAVTSSILVLEPRYLACLAGNGVLAIVSR